MRCRARMSGCLGAILLALLVLVPAGSASAAGCQNQGLKPNKHNLDDVETAMRCLLNGERAKHGLKRLESHSALRKAAERHSQSMVRKRYFAHIGADGSTPKGRMRKAGYAGRVFAENLTYGVGSYATPRSVVRRWMSSGAHRQNILNRTYADMGVGLARGTPEGGGGLTVTMKLGGR